MQRMVKLSFMDRQKTDATPKRTLTAKVARAVWLTVAIVCLVYSEYVMGSNDPNAYKAADTLLLVVMFCLSFPAGFIGVAFTFLYSVVFLQSRPTNSGDLLIVWAAFAAIGYWQWFKLPPWLFEKLFRRGRAIGR